MSNAIGVDACANLLRDYIDEIILEIFGDTANHRYGDGKYQQIDNARVLPGKGREKLTKSRMRTGFLTLYIGIGQIYNSAKNDRVEERKSGIYSGQ